MCIWDVEARGGHLRSSSIIFHHVLGQVLSMTVELTVSAMLASELWGSPVYTHTHTHMSHFVAQGDFKIKIHLLQPLKSQKDRPKPPCPVCPCKWNWSFIVYLVPKLEKSQEL